MYRQLGQFCYFEIYTGGAGKPKKDSHSENVNFRRQRQEGDAGKSNRVPCLIRIQPLFSWRQAVECVMSKVCHGKSLDVGVFLPIGLWGAGLIVSEDAWIRGC